MATSFHAWDHNFSRRWWVWKKISNLHRIVSVKLQGSFPVGLVLLYVLPQASSAPIYLAYCALKLDDNNYYMLICMWKSLKKLNSLWPHGLYSPCNSPGQKTGVGSRSLIQGIFLTRGSNLGLSHFRQLLYQLSHKGSPRILEWVAYPFSSGSFKFRNWTGFFTSWAIREALILIKCF